MIIRIYIVLIVIIVLYCNRNIIDQDSLKEDEGIIIGRIEIIQNGKLCEGCDITFSDEYTNFHSKAGLVIKKSKIGWNEINRIGGSIVALSFIFIEDINIIGNYYEIQGATFQNYGKEKITYFGDITINWDFKNKGEITMTVKNNQSATMAEYQELTGGSIQNVVTSLVKEGK